MRTPSNLPNSMRDRPDIQTHSWHRREHHAPDGGFQNVWPPFQSGSFWKGMKWFLRHSFVKKENRPARVRPVTPGAMGSPPAGVEFTWIGHAAVLVRTPKRSILIDPMFGRRASPFSFAGPRREPALPLQITDLPPIDVVLLSHDHYDHLDAFSIEHLAAERDPLFLVPLGVGRHLEKRGVRHVVELDWWQYVAWEGVRYHCTPAKHFSGRGLNDGNQTLWAGWYMEPLEDEPTIFYAGDTGYGPHLQEIRERLGRPDVALLPIGAYLPRWLMQPIHVNPEEALRAFRDLSAGHFLPVHWGTFDLAEEPLHAPAETLRTLIREQELTERVHLLDIGETWTL